MLNILYMKKPLDFTRLIKVNILLNRQVLQKILVSNLRRDTVTPTALLEGASVY
jgi:hypothetical protein